MKGRQIRDLWTCFFLDFPWRWYQNLSIHLSSIVHPKYSQLAKTFQIQIVRFLNSRLFWLFGADLETFNHCRRFSYTFSISSNQLTCPYTVKKASQFFSPLYISDKSLQSILIKRHRFYKMLLCWFFLFKNRV